MLHVSKSNGHNQAFLFNNSCLMITLRCRNMKHFIKANIVPIIYSSVGIATRYGLDGPGIESRWRRGFMHPSKPALGPTQPPVQWVPCLSWG